MPDENKDISKQDASSVTESLINLLINGSDTTDSSLRVLEYLGLSDPFRRKSITLTDAIRKCAYVPKKLEFDGVRLLRTTLSKITVEEIDTVFPFRNKVDISLIRYGLKDYCRQHPEWRGDLRFCVGLDNVTATNLVLMNKYVDKRYEWVVSRLNANYGVDNYIETAKNFSNYLKANTVDIKIRRNFTEMHVLAGFRTLPFGGFDIVKETDLLATGGAKREVNGVSFVELIEPVMDVLVDQIPVKRMDNSEAKKSFLEYIASGIWITSGASSIGRVEWSLEGESGRIKAKKNNVPYLYTPLELYRIVMNELGKQVNVAITKEETAKIRVAVAGDFPNYIAMSWLFYLLDEDWKLFPHIDSGYVDRLQTNADQLDDLSKNKYALPFDFAGFDRQISTDEMKAIYYQYVKRAKNAGVMNKDEVDMIIMLTMLGFDNSVILTRTPETSRKVVGGLPSGLRITAFLGAMFNLIINLVVIAINLILFNSVPGYLIVKGDDSDLHFKDFVSLVRHRFGFLSLTMFASIGKFSAHYGETEFLRNWFTGKIVTAYTPRAMVSFTQRKTWSNEPFSFDSTTEASKIAARSVSRRAGNEEVFTKLASLMDKVWLNARKLPRWVASLPHSLSGPQLMQFNGVLPDGPFRYGVFDINELKVKVPAEDSIAYTAYILPKGVNLIPDKMILDMFKKSVTINRVNGLSGLITKSIKENTVIPKKTKRIDMSICFREVLKVKEEKVTTKNYVSRKYYRAYTQFQKYVQLSRYDKTVKVSELMRAYFPEFWSEVRRLERVGAHRSTAIDIVMETLSEYNSTNISELIIAQFSALASSVARSYFLSGNQRVRSDDEIRLRSAAWRYALSQRATFAVLESLTQY